MYCITKNLHTTCSFSTLKHGGNSFEPVEGSVSEILMFWRKVEVWMRVEAEPEVICKDRLCDPRLGTAAGTERKHPVTSCRSVAVVCFYVRQCSSVQCQFDSAVSQRRCCSKRKDADISFPLQHLLK